MGRIVARSEHHAGLPRQAEPILESESLSRHVLYHKEESPREKPHAHEKSFSR